MDDLTWPYRWQEPVVEAVHVAFSRWEAQRMMDVYEVQARTRGEVPSEEVRQVRRRHLGKIRAVELAALARLVAAATAGSDPLHVDLGDFARARDKLLAVTPRGRWEEGRLVDAREMGSL